MSSPPATIPMDISISFNVSSRNKGRAAARSAPTPASRTASSSSANKSPRPTPAGKANHSPNAFINILPPPPRSPGEARCTLYKSIFNVAHRPAFITRLDRADRFHRLDDRHAPAHRTREGRHRLLAQAGVPLAAVVQAHHARTPAGFGSATTQLPHRVQRRLQRILHPTHRLATAEQGDVRLLSLIHISEPT